MAVDYEKFRNALSKRESSDNPVAKNPTSSAKGLYQFLDTYDELSQEKMGIDTADLLPPNAAKAFKDNKADNWATLRKAHPKKRGESDEAWKKRYIKEQVKQFKKQATAVAAAKDTDADKQESVERQNEFFEHYYTDVVAPKVAKLRKLDTESEYSDDQLGLMVHFLGGTAASKFVETGKEPDVTKSGNPYNNPTMSKYLKKWDKSYEAAASDKDKVGPPDRRAEHLADQQKEWSDKATSMFGDLDEPTSGGADYVVRRGDTLGEIAKKYGVSIDELAANNNIENPNTILVGQKIRLPGDAEKPAETGVPTYGGEPIPMDPNKQSAMFERIAAAPKEEPVPEMPEPNFDEIMGDLRKSKNQWKTYPPAHILGKN